MKLRRSLRSLVSVMLALCLAFGAVAEEYALLMTGMSGTEVQSLQLALIRLGYGVAEADGSYDEDTVSAVTDFQLDHDLEPTGQADEETQQLIFALAAEEEDAGSATAVPDVEITYDGDDTETVSKSVSTWNGYTVPTGTLRSGSTGTGVLSLQTRLAALGYDVDTTSVYDAATVQAVKLFQQLNGLTADGVAGTKTYAKLYSDAAVTADGTASSAQTEETAVPASTVPSRTLRAGCSGDDVVWLQERLEELGYYTGELTGTYDSDTKAAVKAFQKRNSLTADGVAGAKTYDRLFSNQAIAAQGVTPSPVPTATPTPTPEATAAPASTVPTRTLRTGAEGNDVLWLQSRLIELGYSANRTSFYDTATLNAVKLFQSRSGLTADGVAGAKTLKLLFSDEAVPAVTATPTATPRATATPQPTAAPKATSTPAATAAPTSTVPARTLRSGYKGDDVKWVQQRLAELYYFSGPVTGNYASLTVAAVKAFQKNNGLTADGIAGASTYAKLFSSSAKPAATATPRVTATPKATAAPTPAPTATPAPTWNVPSRTIRSGSEGEDVVWLQVRLTGLGYYAGELTGVCDSATVTAIKAFQKASGLTADGAAGTKTFAKLFADDAKPAGSTATPAPTATVIPLVISTATPAPTATQQSWTVPTRTLKKGLYGDDVKEVQSRLKDLGYFDTPVTGYYSTATVSAVKAFQKNAGLTADGVAGTKTCTLLFSSSAKTTKAPAYDNSTPRPTESYTTLKSGSSGTEVKKLQTALRALGYTVTVNSSYDSATKTAVETFQTNNYLTSDGIAGAETQTLLYSGSAAKASATPSAAYTTLSVNTAAGTTAVTTLQTRLKELGYTVTVNGKYDGTTHNAVVAFQQRNGLMISGIANGATQNLLYSSGAKDASTSVYELPSGTGRITAPDNVQLLWWYTDVKKSMSSGQTVLVYDPETNISWNIKLYSLGKHADSQPATWQDTQLMNRSFGSTSWDCHPVYVRLPDGRWTLAAMHNYPHLNGSISNNGFGGHLCIHFLRTYSECISAGDTNYGVEMQDTIRTFWKALTGETVE